MSIGNAPSALGTLLVHRLDAVLGTTLSQQANLVSGARPDAVSQPGSPERTDPVRNATVRHPQENAERAVGLLDPRRQAASTRTAAGALPGQAATTHTTSSAPTTLGAAARIILELLSNYTGNAAIHARQPLISSLQQFSNTPLQQTAHARATPASPSPSGQSSPAGSPTAAAGASSSAQGILPMLQALTSSTALSGALAQSLFHAIANSGVFYESHLAQLMNGHRSPGDLRAEPQAQFASTQAGPSSGTTGTTAQTVASNSSDTASQLQPSPAGAQQAASTGAIPPELQTLVRMQLEVLANQSLAWRGEVWPEAEMEWEIHRHTTKDEPTHPATEGWSTRLQLQLPNLGSIQVRLTLAGEQVVMHIEASDSAELLSGQSDELHKRLAASGMQLRQLDIRPSDLASGHIS